jgi:photosystem II stability/assembly factor-like uncharacterized protein
MRSLLLVICIIASSFKTQSQFWKEYSSRFPTASTGISRFDIVDENIAWGIGYNGINPENNIQRFSKTTDGGLTWTNGTFTLGNVGLGIADISAINTQIAFVAAYPRSANQEGGVWKTEDGGATWTKIIQTEFSSSSSFTDLLQIYDNGDGIVIGDPINNIWEIYHTADFGATFTALNPAKIPAPQTGETGYLAKKVVVGNSIWFTTSKGRVFHSTNRGLNWSAYSSPISDFGGKTVSGDISFSNASKGILQTEAGVLYSTLNSGATWSQITNSGSGGPYGGNIAYAPG